MLIMALLLVMSCTDRHDKHAEPAVLLPEARMVEIITDVQIMEQAINLRRGRSKSIYNLKTHGFKEIFTHYNITDSIFFENVDYYNSTPETMKRIMDSVGANFQRMQDERKVK